MWSTSLALFVAFSLTRCTKRASIEAQEALSAKRFCSGTPAENSASSVPVPLSILTDDNIRDIIKVMEPSEQAAFALTSKIKGNLVYEMLDQEYLETDDLGGKRFNLSGLVGCLKAMDDKGSNGYHFHLRYLYRIWPQSKRDYVHHTLTETLMRTLSYLDDPYFDHNQINVFTHMPGFPEVTKVYLDYQLAKELAYTLELEQDLPLDYLLKVIASKKFYIKFRDYDIVSAVSAGKLELIRSASRYIYGDEAEFVNVAVESDAFRNLPIREINKANVGLALSAIFGQDAPLDNQQKEVLLELLKRKSSYDKSLKFLICRIHELSHDCDFGTNASTRELELELAGAQDEARLLSLLEHDDVRISAGLVLCGTHFNVSQKILKKMVGKVVGYKLFFDEDFKRLPPGLKLMSSEQFITIAPCMVNTGSILALVELSDDWNRISAFDTVMRQKMSLEECAKSVELCHIFYVYQPTSKDFISVLWNWIFSCDTDINLDSEFKSSVENIMLLLAMHGMLKTETQLVGHLENMQTDGTLRDIACAAALILKEANISELYAKKKKTFKLVLKRLSSYSAGQQIARTLALKDIVQPKQAFQIAYSRDLRSGCHKTFGKFVGYCVHNSSARTLAIMECYVVKLRESGNEEEDFEVLDRVLSRIPVDALIRFYIRTLQIPVFSDSEFLVAVLHHIMEENWPALHSTSGSDIGMVYLHLLKANALPNRISQFYEEKDVDYEFPFEELEDYLRNGNGKLNLAEWISILDGPEYGEWFYDNSPFYTSDIEHSEDRDVVFS